MHLKRRMVILACFGGLLAVVAAAFRYIVAERLSPPDYRSPSSFWTRASTESDITARGVPVIAWYDSARHRLKDAIRIDIVGGVALERKDHVPVGDVISYVNREAVDTRQNFVVVTVAEGERLGDVVRVVDECRQTRATEVVVNMLGYEEQRAR